jgi:hypothetical protein
VLVVVFGVSLFALGLTIGTRSDVSAAVPTNMARPVTTAEAVTILQHALPEVHYGDLHQNALQAPPIDLAQHEVIISYAGSDSASTVAELHVFRADAIQRLEQTGVVDRMIAGIPMRLFVSEVARKDGPLTIMSYTWSRDGLSLALNVFVRAPLTPAIADAIAASVQ